MSESETATPAPDCLFCRAVAGSLDVAVVAESELSLAFRDATPQAPTHVLVIPRRHVRTAVELGESWPDEAADLLRVAGEVARSEGLDDGHRLVFNTDRDGGQLVDHVHLHVLGGRRMGWPPG